MYRFYDFIKLDVIIFYYGEGKNRNNFENVYQ